MREKHVKCITNARVKGVEQDKMSVEELGEDGSVRKTHELPFAYSMMLPAFRGVGAVSGIEKLTNPRGFIIVDKHRRDARAGRRAEDGLHDRIDGNGNPDEHRSIASGTEGLGRADLERRLPRGFRRFRGCLSGAAADSTTQRQ